MRVEVAVGELPCHSHDADIGRDAGNEDTGRRMRMRFGSGKMNMMVDRRESKDVVDELFRRVVAQDFAAIDELMAEDMVNHAAGGADDLRGPQGREGWKQIIATLINDLGDDISVDHHHVVAEGDLVVDHMTLHGRHRASTMGLLDGVKVTDTPVAWTYMHIWRVADGMIVEHWACRDDVGFLRQVGASRLPGTR